MSSAAPEPGGWPAGVREQEKTPFFDRPWVAPAFFVATVIATFQVGLDFGAGYYEMTGAADVGVGSVVLQAAIYTAALVAILGAHEMGHWLVARAHGVKTSLPVFIPMPFGIGTFGAVIAMRKLPPDRTTLLRIGAAGPLAGGVVALALMAIAIRFSAVVPLPDVSPTGEGAYQELGNSLGTILLQMGMPPIPAGHDIAASPLFMAAWAGFLLTSINLFPIGQLDGGHIAYALFGKRMNALSGPLSIGVMLLTFLAIPLAGGVAPQYLVWGILLRVLVAWHPDVPQPEPSLGRGSVAIVIASAVLFLLTFMPAPMRFVW